VSDLRDLYQAVILDHNAKPRNYGKVAQPSGEAQGFNPLCGDRLTLTLSVEGDRIADLKFEGSGCAISRASASLMTSAIKGKTRAEAEALYQRFHELLTTEAAVDPEALGKLAVFAGVREFPARVKCATLGWHVLKNALAGGRDAVSTE